MSRYQSHLHSENPGPYNQLQPKYQQHCFQKHKLPATSRRLRGNGEAKVLASVVCTEDSCVLLIMPKNFYAERDSSPFSLRYISSMHEGPSHQNFKDSS